MPRGVIIPRHMANTVHQSIAAAFDSHGGALVLYARQWTNRGDAEDVVQRVFLKLIAGTRMPVDFRPWLYRCVRNEAISAGRSATRRDHREQRNRKTAMFMQTTDSALDAADAEHALQSLLPNLREVVTLRIWSALTFAEISAVTGTPLSTIHDQYKSALAELRKKLETPCRKP
jgi:RNA polymerase sigma-70 factor (ECF subfamily)